VSAGRRRLLTLVLLPILAAACGRRGSPLPPLRPGPGAIGDLTARRIDDRVELRFTVPGANADGSTPAAITHVEVFRLVVPADVTPTPAEMLDARHLRGRIAIDRPRAARAGEPVGPVPGEMTTYVDAVAGEPRGGALAYAVVGVAARSRRGQPSTVVVPFADVPPAPEALALTFDERQLTLTWQAAGAARFRVYDADPDGRVRHGDAPVRPPVETPSFSEPVVFDRTRCLSVRALMAAGPVTVEGPAAPPVCATPVDRFPPPAPGGLLAFSSDGTVSLTWDRVDAPDLAGYVVLRAQGSGDTLLPLSDVQADLQYTDRQVTRGAVYWYAVRAVDRIGNASAPSARQQVTVRTP
jgi:hypothetical protein